ncbi:MAG: hypothetical protein ACD_79C01452G0001, partial [uncultured bacterium]
MEISNCILNAAETVNGSNGFNSYHANTKVRLWNNIIYGNDLGTGITGNSAAEAIAYNNTIYNCNIGLSGAGVTLAKNNLVQSCVDGYSGAFNAESNYNISDIALDAPGANSKQATVVFKDAANGDFRLAPNDVEAYNAGTDLSADATIPFSTDILGNKRVATLWDIGANEKTRVIYYSVGTSVANLNTNGATVTVTGGYTATFSAVLPDNIGVGDKLTYGGNTAYIYKRNSGTVYLIQSATGGAATNIGAGTACTINRTFNTLSSAEDGADDASYLNTADLQANNIQLHFTCYADGTLSKVTIDGYTTAKDNYIRIYAPNLSSEVGASQRHDGVWNSNYVNVLLTASSNWQNLFYIMDDYVRIEGLQLAASNAGAYLWPKSLSSNDISSIYNAIYISDCIIKSSSSTEMTNSIYIQDGDENAFVYNNVIYDFNNSSGSRFNIINNAKAYVYNNTFFNCYYGMYNSGTGYSVIKNNLIQNCTDGYYGTFDTGSNYNISDLAGDAPGVNSINSKVINFVDKDNKDFHLSGL